MNIIANDLMLFSSVQSKLSVCVFIFIYIIDVIDNFSMKDM